MNTPLSVDSLWLARRVCTLTNHHNYGIIDQGAIAVTNGKIVWLGAQDDFDGGAQTTHDYSQYTLLPGFIDCHTHLVYAGNRAHEFEARITGTSYQEIALQGGGIMATVNATRAATAEDLYQQSAKRLQTLLESGVTSLEIKSGYGLNTETEIKILQTAKRLAENFKLTIQKTFLGAHTIAPEYVNRGDDYIDFICEKMLPEIHALGLVDAVDAYCESIAFSYAQTEKLFTKAAQLQIPIKCHADQLSNQNAAALAAHFKALSADHLEYTSQENLLFMQKAGTIAVLLPGAWYYLQDPKLPPIASFRQLQIPMAIATDCNPGTSPITSMLVILNMSCVLFGMTPLEALFGATQQAACALGEGASLGSLQPGKAADFVIWDIEHPADLCYTLGHNPRVCSIKSGQLVNI